MGFASSKMNRIAGLKVLSGNLSGIKAGSFAAGAIVNADISASAAIAGTKLGNGITGSQIAAASMDGSQLATNASLSIPTGTLTAGTITGPALTETLAASIAANRNVYGGLIAP